MVARHVDEKGRNVVYFRFDYNDIERNSTISFLCSIALRLLEIGSAIYDDIPDSVELLYYEEVKRYSE